MTPVIELGRRAKAASRRLAGAPTPAKNGALLTAADLLLERAAEIGPPTTPTSTPRPRRGWPTDRSTACA